MTETINLICVTILVLVFLISLFYGEAINDRIRGSK
jgi:hypothetical protein